MGLRCRRCALPSVQARDETWRPAWCEQGGVHEPVLLSGNQVCMAREGQPLKCCYTGRCTGPLLCSGRPGSRTWRDTFGDHDKRGGMSVKSLTSRVFVLPRIQTRFSQLVLAACTELGL